MIRFIKVNGSVFTVYLARFWVFTLRAVLQGKLTLSSEVIFERGMCESCQQCQLVFKVLQSLWPHKVSNNQQGLPSGLSSACCLSYIWTLPHVVLKYWRIEQYDTNRDVIVPQGRQTHFSSGATCSQIRCVIVKCAGRVK